MKPENLDMNRRILLIDDNEGIHKDIRKILTPPTQLEESEDVSSAFLGRASKPVRLTTYDIDSAYQGQDGARMCAQALADNNPYALAFVDMRMPPGWDGVETIEHLWKIDPDLQVVICTAYTDCSWEQILERYGETDQLLILKKPFDHIEVQQLALAMTSKWNLMQRLKSKSEGLERAVSDRTDKLRDSNLRLSHNATHDSLTNLPNRAMLLERLGQSIKDASGAGGGEYAVLFIDIDDFKLYNDSLGHHAGDLLLKEVGARLASCVGCSEAIGGPVGDTTARLGGDEFVILMNGLEFPAEVQRIADHINHAMEAPFRIEGRDVIARVSIGITSSIFNYHSPADVLRDADIALYRAKALGKGVYSIFDESMRQQVMDRFKLECDLRFAVPRGQIEVAYQPLVSLETGRIKSFEALARWRHPEYGMISPLDFIPVAEEMGVIHEIGLFILHESCCQLKHWQAKFPEYKDLQVSVNLSNRQLDVKTLVDDVDRVLADTGLSPSCLKLEVTESIMIEGPDKTAGIFQQFIDRGIELYMDDFGTGYSSLSIFHTLPIAALKLDQAFISNMGLDGEYGATVQAIVTLAKNRGIRVIAEGVETVGQLAQLIALECDMIQGYYISKPVFADSVESMLLNDETWIRQAG